MKTSNSLPDKTQEELRKILSDLAEHLEWWNHHDRPMQHANDTPIDNTLRILDSYINKYYVPKGDLESPSVANEVGGNQVDKLSELLDEENYDPSEATDEV